MLRADGLRAADSNGKSDPYAKVRVGKHKGQTKVVPKSLDPDWNQRLVFPGTLADFIEETLTIKVRDKDKVGHDDPLGEVQVRLGVLDGLKRGSSRLDFAQQMLQPELPAGGRRGSLPGKGKAVPPPTGTISFTVSWLPDGGGGGGDGGGGGGGGGGGAEGRGASGSTMVDVEALQALVDAPSAPGLRSKPPSAAGRSPLASPSAAGGAKTAKVLSVDFVREGKAAPKEKGQYFGLNAAEASARLGAPLISGNYRVAHLRTGMESDVRIWTPVGAGVSDNYTTVGNAMGRWEPIGSVPHQWHLGDELRFVTSQPPAAAAAAAAADMLGAIAAGLGLGGGATAPPQGGGAEAVVAARREVLAFMECKTVHFNGAGDPKVSRVEQSWSVSFEHDRSKAAKNVEVLDGIAAIMRSYPDLGVRVHAETGNADTAPDRLAARYGLHPRADVQACMDHLACNRAAAVVAALEARGIAAPRLTSSYKGRTGSLKIDFSPLPMDAVATARREAAARPPPPSGTVPEFGLSSQVKVRIRGSSP